MVGRNKVDDLHFYEKEIGKVTNVEGEENKKEATITNTFKVPNDTIELTVNKVWVDNEVQAQRDSGRMHYGNHK